MEIHEQLPSICMMSIAVSQSVLSIHNERNKRAETQAAKVLTASAEQCARKLIAEPVTSSRQQKRYLSVPEFLIWRSYV